MTIWVKEMPINEQDPIIVRLLAQTDVGLKNLFKLISFSHIQLFLSSTTNSTFTTSKISRRILVGSGCDKGEVFEGMMQKGPEEVEEIAEFYDYLEVHPKEVYQHLIELELIRDEKSLEDIIGNIVKLGEKLNIPVVATGNVHYLNPNDKIYRKILVNSQGGANPLNRHKLT